MESSAKAVSMVGGRLDTKQTQCRVLHKSPGVKVGRRLSEVSVGECTGYSTDMVQIEYPILRGVQRCLSWWSQASG